MSFAGYFFGNVDKSGKVEDLPEEFREALESLENSEQLTHLFSAKTLGVDESEVQPQGPDASGGVDNDEDDEEDQDGEVNFATIKSTFEHDKDAVDFSEINDLAVDNSEQMFSNQYLQKGLSTMASTAMKSNLAKSASGNRGKSRLDSMDEDYDADGADEERAPTTSLSLPPSSSTASNITTAPKSALSLLQQQQLYLLEEQQKLNQTAAGSAGSKVALPPSTLPPLSGTTAGPSAPVEPIDVHALYPAFEKNKILKFSELFNIKRLKRFPHSKVKPADFPTINKFTREYDQRKIFDQPEDPISVEDQDVDPYDAYENLVDKEWANSLQWKVPDTKDLYSVQLEEWEDKIIWDDAVVPLKTSETSGAGSTTTENTEDSSKEIFAIRNYELENGDWEESIIWDENKPFKPFTQISFNMNDANVLFDLTSMDSKTMGEGFRVKRGKKAILPAYRVVTKTNDPSEEETHRKLQIDRFNLSNDRFYEAHKEGRFHRVRQTFGQLVVQHALPAVKLMKPWYKNKLTKSEQRSFHRPQLQLPLNVDITFSRVKGSKKKKQKRKELGEVMRGSKDLTLRDNTNFVLLEYSEEHPAIIQNVGMGSFLINYYRKENIDDTHIPQKEIGEPFVLDVADASPFLGFGNVEPGQTISALYNNLIRAPVFEQPARNTDFLVIRTTYKGETKYYIRHIPHLYVVGQTYPVQDVPGPHSRKITTMVKNRLQISAFRFIRKDPYNRLRFAKLVKAYPEYSEIQIRQRLKEFAEFQRKGNNTGFWKLKASTPLPSEEEIRKLVTPEMVCLYESMLVGQRYLQDAGYGKAADGEDDGNEDYESNMDIEEQLAPWITTRNFINATQGKAMLKLWGAGDPTGRGEGFSFVRISMKDIFLRQGESLEERLAQIELLPKSTHRYNVAEQQQVYKEEITRIWNMQHQALSNTEEIDGNDDVIGNEEEEENLNRQRREMSTVDRSRVSPSPSLFGRYRDSADRGGDRDRDRDNDMDDDNVSVAGSISSRTSVGNFGSSRNKCLIIKRLIRLENGETTWKSETIRDPAVMNAYIRQRQLIEENSISTEALEPTNDEAKNERMRKRILEEIARLNRNQERRMARAAAKAGNTSLDLPVNPATATLKKKVIRQCSNCGALGHMKTNKKCPKYVDPSGALPNLGVTGTGYMTAGGVGSIMSPPHVPVRPTPLAPPSAPPPMVRGGSMTGDFIRQGSPQSSGVSSNKISIPKAVIDRVADLEKEREKEEKEALVVRLPSKMLQPTPPKRKRSESATQHTEDDFMDYFPPVKSYGRRKKADVELANIIESVLSTILSMQEATAFISPVSSKIAPGYDIVIKQPRDLSGMRDANKNYYAYRTVDAFLTDMRIMVNNSWIYNGEHSPWTKAAMVLLEKAEGILAPQMETIRQLEQEILEADMKANIYGGMTTPGGTGPGGATSTPPPANLPSMHPGGYGVYTSATFPGIGKPFLGFPVPGSKNSNNSNPSTTATTAIAAPLSSSSSVAPDSTTSDAGEVQVKAENMDWQ
ncbi:hypothetical protein BX616_000573 [Lobosporangium transversale]|uniref:Bromo domain-containing protein n=1 Tax=Lobosporangium transversale TaxID=64571 RepID=A0A1Y2GHJ5_9FUNG|nr:hypothetical protein BCR41DRAFT_424708 [Lobosporangium transversale]KAF9917575.1 hypothetical protein BX616_000573 [Lobosporangium transversale]ORZ07744.1 hypothetical protein BCR41DRAFT_424708 [Lobosporangium transversale]|eukprot:XP_021878110.1 hypothetical protein BCR41DRAFT_424708 [Lobosporangium transversale]